MMSRKKGLCWFRRTSRRSGIYDQLERVMALYIEEECRMNTLPFGLQSIWEPLPDRDDFWAASGEMGLNLEANDIYRGIRCDVLWETYYDFLDRR